MCIFHPVFLLFYFWFFSPEPMTQSGPGLIQELDYLPSSRLGREQSNSVLCGEKGFRRRHHLHLFWFCAHLFLITLKSISSLITFASGQGNVCHADLLRPQLYLAVICKPPACWVSRNGNQAGGIAQLPVHVPVRSWWLLCSGHQDRKTLEVQVKSYF